MSEQCPRSASASTPPLETPRQRMCRELKERVDRGEYWVDLDLLSSLLVDSQATLESEEPTR